MTKLREDEKVANTSLQIDQKKLASVRKMLADLRRHGFKRPEYKLASPNEHPVRGRPSEYSK